MPWAPTVEFAHPFVVFADQHSVETKKRNKLSYSIVHELTWAGCSDLINQFRSEVGLPYATAASVSKALAQIPQSLLISPAFCPQPPDYGPLVESTGFCFPSTRLLGQSAERGVGDEALLGPRISAFLQGGSMPVYCGLGSMTGFDFDSLYGKFIKAVQELGLRAIVCTGWATTSLSSTQDILVICDAPHEQ